MIGGSFGWVNGTRRYSIAKLKPNGSFDTGFNDPTSIDNSFESIALQNDGKILVGGSFNSFNCLARNHIVRINASAELDNTFDIGAGFAGGQAFSFVTNVKSLPDGKIPC